MEKPCALQHPTDRHPSEPVPKEVLFKLCRYTLSSTLSKCLVFARCRQRLSTKFPTKFDSWDKPYLPRRTIGVTADHIIPCPQQPVATIFVDVLHTIDDITAHTMIDQIA